MRYFYFENFDSCHSNKSNKIQNIWLSKYCKI